MNRCTACNITRTATLAIRRQTTGSRCFAGAITQACIDMIHIADEMNDLRAGWIKRLGTVGTGSTLEHMPFAIQELPYFSVNTMVREGVGSKQSVGKTLERLLRAQIVCQTNRGKRDRIFETPEVLEQFAIIERRLASPARDTNAAPPVRPVPYSRPRLAPKHPPA